MIIIGWGFIAVGVVMLAALMLETSAKVAYQTFLPGDNKPTDES